MLSHSVADVDNSLVMSDIEILPKPGACPGICPHFNEGTSCYLSWPYGLIPHLGLVWNLTILNDVLTMHSQNCTLVATLDGCACCPCWAIGKSEKFMKIQQWITHGTPDTTPHIYQGMGNCLKVLRQKDQQIDALKLKGINNTHKLRVLAKSNQDYE